MCENLTLKLILVLTLIQILTLTLILLNQHGRTRAMNLSFPYSLNFRMTVMLFISA
jgi:hypothetical protein